MRKFCLKCSHIEENLEKSTCIKCDESLQLDPSNLRDDLKVIVTSSKNHAKAIIDNKLNDYLAFLNILQTNQVLPLFHLQVASASILTAILKIGDLLSYEDQLILVKSLCTTFTEITGLDALTENLNYFQNNQKELTTDKQTIQFIGAWPVLASLNLSKDLQGFNDLYKMGEATQSMLMDFGIFISEFSDQLVILIEKSKVN
ncbi:MAG: hypothetical protein COB02_15710 [Candidatus Cloacimonadota bacterium]|nr:MAG: hypothetical protein COB02_15710 [Candidatus Cloacimonadota bacterium]